MQRGCRAGALPPPAPPRSRDLPAMGGRPTRMPVPGAGLDQEPTRRTPGHSDFRLGQAVAAAVAGGGGSWYPESGSRQAS